MSIDKHTTQAGFEEMTVDLESTKIDQNGIPVEMAPHENLFGRRFKFFENDRPLYEFLLDIDPVLKKEESKFEGKTYYDYMVWEITPQIVLDFMKSYYNEKDRDWDAHMEDWEIDAHMDSLKEAGTFDGGKIFVVYG